MPPFIRCAIAASLTSFIALPAAAQTAFPEIEPNGTKPEATPVVCLLAGDYLTGTTTGTGSVSADSSSTSVDVFKVKTCTLASGIYRHQLAITTAGTAGHIGTIRGLNQTGTIGVGGTPGTVDSQVQASLTTTTPARMNQWYGFGGGGEIYYRVAGTASTTSSYTSTLTTAPVTPVVIGPFQPGQLTFKFCGTGASADTELWVYDSTLNAIPGYGDDDSQPSSPCGQTTYSSLVRNFAAGTYYVAVSTYNLASNQAASATDQFVTGLLLDFPGVIADSEGYGGGYNLSFSVTDSAGTVPVAATKSAYYEILWFKFIVGSGSAGTAFCIPSTSGVIACACGNPNGAGAGCANTGSSGGILGSAGSASLAADATDPGSVTLTGTNMLSGSTCVFLQGPTPIAAGVTFGAGIRCVGGQLMRLYVKGIVGGTKTVPEAGDRSISNRTSDLFPGMPITANSTWYYQAYYRDPTIANPGGSCPANATFNITAGQQITWAP